jgi:hypothetical protein
MIVLEANVHGQDLLINVQESVCILEVISIHYIRKKTYFVLSVVNKYLDNIIKTGVRINLLWNVKHARRGMIILGGVKQQYEYK